MNTLFALLHCQCSLIYCGFHTDGWQPPLFFHETDFYTFHRNEYGKCEIYTCEFINVLALWYQMSPVNFLNGPVEEVLCDVLSLVLIWRFCFCFFQFGGFYIEVIAT